MAPILVAIPAEWNPPVCQHLEQLGYETISAFSYEDAYAIIQQSEKLRGVIIVSDWAMVQENTPVEGIVIQVKGKIPTITIITFTSRQQIGYRYMGEVYFPPMHEYITQPMPLDQLEVCMRKIGMI